MTATPPADVLLAEPPALATPASRLTHLLNRLQPSPEAIALMLAVSIGCVTGIGVVVFHYLIEWVHSLLLEDVMGLLYKWGPWTLACVPTIGGAIVGLMRWCWPDFGPSMSSLIAASQGTKKPLALRPAIKMVAAAVSLGSGASLGPEGPSVEIGANFGTLLSQALQVSKERRQLLLGAGAAAGLAAGFNAPIAGVFFALELVLGTTFATSAVSVVLLAAVVASLIAQIGLGAQPAFTLPAYEVRSPLELPLYMGLGVLASLVSVVYIRSIQVARQCFRGQVRGFSWLSRWPRSLTPAMGGLLVGLAALQWPQIMGIGYETVEAMLQDVKFSLPLLLSLLAVKLVMTAISLGSGLVGGIFAPAMFLGASLGAAYGKILAALLPASIATIAAPPAYAMVGMAAVLAGSARAPLTSILLLFELTRDYRIVLPLMAAVGLSIWLVERLQPTPEAGQNLQQLGLNFEKGQNAEILRSLPVSEAMHPPGTMFADTTTIVEAALALTSSQGRSGLVTNDSGQLVGIVTLQDLKRAIAQLTADALNEDDNWISPTLSTVCTTDILYAYPDESVAEALDRMAARGLHQLPVVERDNIHQVLGVLERDGIDLACNVAATRQVLHQHLSQTALRSPIGLTPSL
jgi:H+/Cl- antiporter ClcA